jgi:hypothetical protein
MCPSFELLGGHSKGAALVLIGLVAGLVADDDEAGDLIACEGEVVGEDQRVGEPGL